MTTKPLTTPADPKTIVLAVLARLRAAFPLEAQLLAAPESVHVTYVRVLSYWLAATAPPLPAVDSAMLNTLEQLDAVVLEEQGLGCYPFSSTDNGMRVTWSAGTVHACSAIDALAIARRVRATSRVDAACLVCGAAIACQVLENGGLDHDQVDAARVVWLAGPAADAARRHIRFLCNSCSPAQASECLSLPQATAIGNAYYGFQAALLMAHAARATSP